MALCLYRDPAPSIGVYIKLIQIQTRTNLEHKPQWKKWCQIQNFVWHSTEITRQGKMAFKTHIYDFLESWYKI